MLGLPDLYDTDVSSEGLGKWSIMAGGSWNGGGASPAHFDAWCKKFLAFSEVQPVMSNQTEVEILQAETSPVSYRLWTSGVGGSEYFLVENRQKVGFDKYLPGHGLLIYHVDEDMPYNSNEWCPGDPPTPHYMVALEQADGLFQLEGCYGPPNSGDAGDPFPGSSDKRAFDDTTTPSSRDYYDSSTHVAVWNISDSDSAMYANFNVLLSGCGDCNLDGVTNIADVVCKINYIFLGGPLPCPPEFVDHNGDGVVNIADVVAEINYLFGGAPLECPLLK